MATMISHRERLQGIRTFPQLLAYLRDEMGWPIEKADFEDLTFDFTPEELGIDPKEAAKIKEIKRLRPLSAKQPWGIFFVKFEPKRLPVVALRRILSQVVLKKRESANKADRAVWAADDLLFISNYGEGEARQITFAHFSQSSSTTALPSLKVLGWDNLDTPLHLDSVADQLRGKLAWPDDETDVDSWRTSWRSAFTVGHGEVIATSKALAVRLATLARMTRDRILSALTIETENGPLRSLMQAFRSALVHDLNDASFADMYAQTIAYGLLSARIANPIGTTAEDLSAQMPVTSPFLRELMTTFLHAGGRRSGSAKSGIDFDELGIGEVVELLNRANMNAVIRDFGDRNPLEDPVIHFYELFLTEYDAKRRMERGVFYTPRPIVSYIVRSIDELLRSQFGLVDGLADTATWGEVAARFDVLEVPSGVSPHLPFVQILDPATGTGTFLVEVITSIHATLTSKWGAQGKTVRQMDESWNEYVTTHLLPRLHGYELMMAPYAIAHLKIGLKLHETGYRFASRERVRVYLTNALEPSRDISAQADFALAALAHEAQAVSDVKRSHPFTVVLGNPPYSGHSSNNQIDWIVDKVYDYKRGVAGLEKAGQAKWLQDDYVKFVRLAEFTVMRAGVGVVGFITNHAWLENPTFRGMRAHLLSTFNRVSVLDLHGNANRGGGSEGDPSDENVFEIRQGVAVAMLERHATLDKGIKAFRGDARGSSASKFTTLANAVSEELCQTEVSPSGPDFILRPLDEDRKKEYESFWAIPSIMNRNGDPAPGMVTTHDDFAISFSQEEQTDKVHALLATRSEADARQLFKLCSTKQWIYADAKSALKHSGWQRDLLPILYRPFDVRWTVYNRHVAVHRRERVSRHMLSGRNIGLSIPRACEIKRGWEHAFCSRLPIGLHTVSIKEVNYLFPLWLEPELADTNWRPNVADAAAQSLASSTGLRFSTNVTDLTSGSWDGRGDLATDFGPQDVFDYIYAVLHTPGYRIRYAAFLNMDFARVPLAPNDRLFRELALCGRKLVALHLLEDPLLDAGEATYSGRRNPEVQRVGWSEGTVWLDARAAGRGEDLLPGSYGFGNVSPDAWNFHIGGYRVCEKWLKDRKGRVLSSDELRHYARLVTASAETAKVLARLDQVVESFDGWPRAFAGS